MDEHEINAKEFFEASAEKPRKDLVVLSGGLDSTTILSLVDQFGGPVEAISFSYGQRHDREVQKAAAIAKYFNVDHFVQEIQLGKGGILMDHEAPMVQMSYEEIKESVGVSPTYVPFRNGTFLSLAASHALETGCDMIWAGMHAEDARGWAYPDCSPEFIGAMQNAIYVGTYHKVRLSVPFQYMSKAEIIEQGLRLNTPYRMTMSCYEGREPACGQCPTCISRLEAFKANHYKDPISYEFDQYREAPNGER